MSEAREAVTESPADITARVDRYTAVGRFAEAERMVRRALMTYPEHINLLNKLSYTLFSQQRYDEDLEVTDRALALDPDEPVLYWRRSWTLWRLERRDEAIALARRSLELDPHRELRHAVFEDLGRYYNWEGRHPEAFEITERGLTEFPGDTALLEVAGEALRRQSKYYEADAYYRASLEADPHLGINWYGKALNDMMLGRARVSLAGFAHSMVLEPDDEWRAERVRYFMGWPISGYAASFRWSLPLASATALLNPSGTGWPRWFGLVLLALTLAHATSWLYRGGKLAWTALPRLLPLEKLSIALPAVLATLGLTAAVLALLTGSAPLGWLGLAAGVLLWPAFGFDNALNPNESRDSSLVRRTLANTQWWIIDDFTGHPRKQWERLRRKLKRDKDTPAPT